MSRHFAPGRDGCNGGRAFQAMQSIADFGGIIPASALPYRGMGTGCSEAVELRSEVVTQLTSTAFHEIRRDESAMVAQLMESTLSIALSASGEQTQVSSHNVDPAALYRRLPSPQSIAPNIPPHPFLRHLPVLYGGSDTRRLGLSNQCQPRGAGPPSLLLAPLRSHLPLRSPSPPSRFPPYARPCVQ